jgi:DNA-binding transcriptional MerR regulator
MMTVSQHSKRNGIAPHVGRYYSRIDLLTPAQNPDNDYRSVCFIIQSVPARQCTKYGVAQTLSPWNPTLPPIVHARRYHASALHSYYQDSRFTFENIRHIMGLSEAGESPCQEVREIMRRRVEKNRRRLVDQIALQRRMEQALACREKMSNAPPRGDEVCHLIESVAGARIET